MGVEVCPVHRTEYKCGHPPCLHVASSMSPRGVKRKHPDEQPRSYAQERKDLLDLTCDKLKRATQLHRQVLMTNIIRGIQLEMARDGLPPASSLVPVWSATPHSSLDPPPSPAPHLDPSSGQSCVAERPATPAPHSAYGDHSPEPYDRCLMDVDSARATPFLRASYERAESWTEEGDRLSSLNWSSVLKSASLLDVCSGASSDCSLASEDAASGPTSLHIMMPAAETTGCFGVFSATNCSGSTSPASGSSSEDEIFGDVDLTLYDYDYTPLSPPNVAMAPLSAEELMWSLSHDQQKPQPTTQDDRDFLASVVRT